MAKKFLCSDTAPIVSTKYGKLRGFQTDDLYCFFGVDYAQAKRYEEPREIDSWDGVKDALNYGYVCPLMNQDVADKELLVPHRYWLMSENCLNLNVWTTSLERTAKKPVMVWFHGGAYTAGSSIEHICYEGDNLAKYGDVVMVSVNHRLNVIGYLDLADYGEEYKNSANLGNADLVASLKWVRDNIESFGGDPENVTIFGQSGGGMKVINLMNTPEANGLFHKAIIESGVDAIRDGGDTKIVVEKMLNKLSDNATVEDLKTLPYARLVEIYQEVVFELKDQKGVHYGSWPKQNEWYLGDPCSVGFSENAKKIPVLVGSVMGEFNFEKGVEGKYKLSEEECMALVKEKYGEHSEELIEEFKKAYPGKNLTDALYLDQIFRAPTKNFIQKRLADNCTDTYCYMFTYDFPIDGGKVAWHCSEIPFAFHNTEKTALYNVEGETDIIEQRFFEAFVNFAKTGKPSSSALPLWPKCEVGAEKCMIIDKECYVATNFDNELLNILDKTNTKTSLTHVGTILPASLGVKVVH